MLLIIFYVVLGGLALSIILLGLIITQQQQRRIIECFGRYIYTLKPGLGWIFPFVMKVRATASIWEQSIPLFEEPIKIDFKDGSAIPKGAEAFLKIKSPDIPYSAEADTEEKKETGVYRSIYEINNWRTASRDMLENAARSLLNSLFIDEALVKGKGGFDLKDHISKKNKKEYKKIVDLLESWGFELRRITIQDFELEKDLVVARGEVQKRKREREVAIEERQIRADETIGSLIDMVSRYTGMTTKEIQEEISGNAELKEKFFDVSKDLITRKMSIERDALTDIRTQTGSAVGNEIMNLLAAFKKIK